jgi:integrase
MSSIKGQSSTPAQSLDFTVPTPQVSPSPAEPAKAGKVRTPKAKPAQRGQERPEAVPYLEGVGYAIRCRYKSNDSYLSGFKSKAAATKAARKRRDAIDEKGIPKGLGADKTTAGQALQDYAMERLRFNKGAVQEAVRINAYLRELQLDTLVVRPLKAVASASVAKEPAASASPQAKKDSKDEKPPAVYFTVTLEPFTGERVIPNGLHAHRRAQMTKIANARKHRAVLARTKMTAIHRANIQAYMDALRDEGASPATMRLEQALWRRLFYYAFSVWAWASLKENPATLLTMPAVDNERKRMMSYTEQELLDAALLDCRNKLVAPVLTLLRETAMRASEPLEHARWGDVDWTRRVLRLTDAKAGKRDVPLSPAAIQVLRDLGPGEPDEPIVKISYDALKKAMERACERAGIKNLKLHDMRRTAATRLALKTGNLFLVKSLTGHKTNEMAARYLQVGADDVVAFMHSQQESLSTATVALEFAKSDVQTSGSLAVAQAQTFTMEQMQAMAQLAAQAAIAEVGIGKSPPPERLASSVTKLVTPTAAAGPADGGRRLRLVS